MATGDVLDPEAMARACAGAGYLVHSLTRRGFAGLDRRAALVTSEAAREAWVSRMVYLGGLRPEAGAAGLSDHLASRAEVGETFLRSGVPSAVLQAAVIIGSGSANFEILRYLTERLPVLVDVAPFHAVVLGGMARNITRTAERLGAGPGTPPSPGRPR